MKRIIVIVMIIALAFTLIACGGNDKNSAKSCAKEYCNMLQSQHSEIEYISFTGEDRCENGDYYFEVEVKYSSSSRMGEVKCCKDSDGDYVVESLTFY